MTAVAGLCCHCRPIALVGDAENRWFTVSAARSLMESSEGLEKRFWEEHPQACMTFHLSTAPFLLARLESGAPAASCASTDLLHLQHVQDAGLLAGEPIGFVRNRGARAVPNHNPAQIHRVRALVRSGVRSVREREDLRADR